MIAENLLKIFEMKCRVKHLAFVKFPFTDKAFSSFCRFFSEDMCLESLDISYTTGIKPISFLPFFEALSQNKKLRTLNLAYCNFIEDQDVAMAKQTNQATLYRKLLRMQEVAALKNKPGQKPITIDDVMKEIANEKAVLTGSPVKKRNVPGGKKSKIDEDIHPLKPNFDVLDIDYDL